MKYRVADARLLECCQYRNACFCNDSVKCNSQPFNELIKLTFQYIIYNKIHELRIASGVVLEVRGWWHERHLLADGVEGVDGAVELPSGVGRCHYGPHPRGGMRRRLGHQHTQLEQVFRYSASAVPRLKVDRAHWVVVSPQGEPSLAEAGPQVSGV